MNTKISEINNMENKVINKCLENNIIVTFCGKLDDNYFIYYQDLVLQLESKVYYLPTEYLFILP